VNDLELAAWRAACNTLMAEYEAVCMAHRADCRAGNRGDNAARQRYHAATDPVLALYDAIRAEFPDYTPW
jgi:hypothetical protein